MKKEIFLNKLSARIRELRIEKGLTQVQLAERIGKKQQSIQKVESGKVNPRFKTIREIAKGLEITVTKLFDTL